MRRLSLEELFIGAWLRYYMDMPNRYSEPMYVFSLYQSGSVYLATRSDGYDAVSADLANVAPIAINEAVLRGFGFEKAKGNDVFLKVIGDMRMTVSLRWKHGEQQCKRVALTGKTTCWNEEIRYVHELQRWWTDRVLLPFGIPLVLEWRGKRKEDEHDG